jgi:hypothetical protein
MDNNKRRLHYRGYTIIVEYTVGVPPHTPYWCICFPNGSYITHTDKGLVTAMAIVDAWVDQTPLPASI